MISMHCKNIMLHKDNVTSTNNTYFQVFTEFIFKLPSPNTGSPFPCTWSTKILKLNKSGQEMFFYYKSTFSKNGWEHVKKYKIGYLSGLQSEPWSPWCFDGKYIPCKTHQRTMQESSGEIDITFSVQTKLLIFTNTKRIVMPTIIYGLLK